MDLSAQLSTSTHARCEQVAGGPADPFPPNPFNLRFVGHSEVIQFDGLSPCRRSAAMRLVPTSRLVGSDLRSWHRSWADDEQTDNPPPPCLSRPLPDASTR